MTHSAPIVARHLRIRGRVQGVMFRASTVKEARRLGVAGWVRNRADGSVEAWVEGAPEAVNALVEWAHQGPPRARVVRVEAEEVGPGALAGFEQRSTR